jgi:hypothetical protein
MEEGEEEEEEGEERGAFGVTGADDAERRLSAPVPLLRLFLVIS